MENARVQRNKMRTDTRSERTRATGFVTVETADDVESLEEHEQPRPGQTTRIRTL